MAEKFLNKAGAQRLVNKVKELIPSALHKKYTLSLTSLSTDKFYPVTFEATDDELDCQISSWGGESTLPYNNNHIHFLLSSRGWADVKRSFVILSQGNYTDTEITIGAIGCGSKKGEKCVWLRGGVSYTIISNHAPTMRTASYTSTSDEVYSVGSNLDGGTNTSVNTIWKNDGSRSNNVVVSKGDSIDASTLGGLNADDIKKQAFIDLWKEATKSYADYGGYDEETGYFIINGLEDVTYEEAIRIYNAGVAHYPTTAFYFCYNENIRSAFIAENVYSRTLNMESMFEGCYRLHSIGHYETFVPSNVKNAFYRCKELEEIIIEISFAKITSAAKCEGCFTDCQNLREVRILDLKTDLNLGDCKNLSYESLKVIAEFAANTSAIRVDVHSDVYDKLTNQVSNPVVASMSQTERQKWHDLYLYALSKDVEFIY